LLPNGQARKLFDLVEGPPDARSNNFTFGKFVLIGAHQLDRYCGLDTYAMYAIWKHLNAVPEVGRKTDVVMEGGSTEASE